MSEFTIKRVEAGKEILIELSNRKGMDIVLSNLGASLRSCKKPGRELTLGYPDPDTYRQNPAYFGTTVGRYGNRIAKGHCVVAGQKLELECNNPPNHLHGGNSGFHSRYWDVELVEGGFTSNDRGKVAAAGASFTLTSPAGDGAYPGTLHARVTILLTADNQLAFFYAATSDAPTIVNLTNHSYWNLQGESGRTIHEHKLQLSAKGWLEVDPTMIPIGRLQAMKGSAWDFSKDKAIKNVISAPAARKVADCTKGIDHCFMLDPALPQMSFGFHAKSGPAAASQDGKLRYAGRLSAPESPSMEVFTSLPGIQIYTGNFLDDIKGRNGQIPLHGGICLETQLFPDSPNQAPIFRSLGKRYGWPEAEMTGWDALLQPGKAWKEVTVHRFN